uniref:Zinc finger MYM-type protein 1 n=1 Tax=Cajanus cajan TaxID=3821 RepID=A0A151S5P2_CAJCA|nr:Zinc finger MYM-type protein 1 [Cajanus cajan]
MIKSKRIDSFFKRKTCDKDEKNATSTSSELEKFPKNPRIEENDKQLSKVPRVTYNEFENSLERDPGKRPQIWQYPSNQTDEVRRAYLKWGPYQMHLENYPLSGKEDHPRRFQYTWFSIFPSWLEYSPSKDAAYCLPCYLFSKPSGRLGSDVFIATGFKSWRKVNNGKNCAFLKHIGKDPCSPHNNAVRACQDLLNQNCHIRNVFHVQSLDQIMKNHLRLKTSIDTVRYLSLQACAFRGHDETSESRNQGNFLEMIKLIASYNDEVAKVVLENAPYNSKYTSHKIQKEILNILSSKVKNHIREEVGDSKFCIIVDEARDESKKEQMALILRFVDKNGFIQERFFDIVHVKDTTTLTLKNELFEIFSVAIDKQLQELNCRFNDQAMELLTLSMTLVPKDAYKAFNIEDICTLVDKYYPMDFSEQEKINLHFQLQHFIVDARQDSNLKNLSTMQELCTCLATTKKSEVYYLIDRLLRLIMTLPVSTATTERSFSTMKLIKTRLRNKMEVDFLADSMIVYIERDIVTSFSSNSIIEHFKSLKERRAAL